MSKRPSNAKKPAALPPQKITRRQALASGVTAIAGLSATPALAAASKSGQPKKWDHEFDVVVIGFGVAGGSAAYEAVAAGKRVLVLDRGAAAANASHGSNVYLGGGTPLQKAYDVDDSPEEMERYLLASQAPNPDHEKIRIYVEQSPEHYRWLSKLGIDFCEDPDSGCLIYSGGENTYPCNEMAKPAMRGHRHSAGATGKWIQQKLLAATRNAGVTLWLKADAEGLVRGEDGVVEGVIAKVDGSKTTQAIRATSGVILASGGFANNREMIAYHAPLYSKANPLDVFSNDGWGVLAAQEVGAAVRQLGAVCCFYAIGPPTSRYEGILVNANGQRFVTEEDVAWQYRLGDRIVREQHGTAFLITDSKFTPGETTPGAVAEKASAEAIPAPGAIAATASNIAELERELKMPEGALTETLSLYNRHAAKGKDPFFHKSKEYVRPLDSAPYTAVRLSLGDSPFAYFTVGGLRTNSDTRVLDHKDNIIPGLFAAGRVASGILNYQYYLSGLSLGESTLFGRIAGKVVATTS